MMIITRPPRKKQPLDIGMNACLVFFLFRSKPLAQTNSQDKEERGDKEGRKKRKRERGDKEEKEKERKTKRKKRNVIDLLGVCNKFWVAQSYNVRTCTCKLSSCVNARIINSIVGYVAVCVWKEKTEKKKKEKGKERRKERGKEIKKEKEKSERKRKERGKERRKERGKERKKEREKRERKKKRKKKLS